MGDTLTDEGYIDRCLELGEKGLGSTAPNPMVGCVLVTGGRIIGEGYHREYGGAHAEAQAIASVRKPELLTSCTMYVNLEPCAHHGKTPPCSDLILEEGIPRVDQRPQQGCFRQGDLPAPRPWSGGKGRHQGRGMPGVEPQVFYLP